MLLLLRIILLLLLRNFYENFYSFLLLLSHTKKNRIRLACVAVKNIVKVRRVDNIEEIGHSNVNIEWV